MTKKIFGLIALVLFAAIVSTISISVTSVTVELTPAEEISRATEDGYNKGFADRLAMLARVTELENKLNTSELSNTEKAAIIAELQSLLAAVGNGGGTQDNNLLSEPLEMYIRIHDQGRDSVGANIVLVRNEDSKDMLLSFQGEDDNVAIFMLPENINAIKVQVRIDHLQNGVVTQSTIIERIIGYDAPPSDECECLTIYNDGQIPLVLAVSHTSYVPFGLDLEFTNVDIYIDDLDFDPTVARIALTSVVFV
jgi:hypothetical protein